VPLCPPQTPHAARMRTRAAAVGSQRLIASATARPYMIIFTRNKRTGDICSVCVGQFTECKSYKTYF
jgi:hypothetical protein